MLYSEVSAMLCSHAMLYSEVSAMLCSHAMQ